jgi:ABC-type phosphate/phosphonate transport system substrate-binding protein
MMLCKALRRQAGHGFALLASVLATLLAAVGEAGDGQQTVDVLRIGSSGSLAGPEKEKASLATLKSFIKDETGLDNAIYRQKDWRVLADKMARGNLHLGVFPGNEFAWAKAKHAKLKALALAVNVYRYPVAYVVTKKDDPAKDFTGLQGHSFALPANGQGFLKLYVERECEAAGKKMDAFFSKVTRPSDVEVALDDVVDGTVQATVADRAALEAYKGLKPGRFRKLNEVAKSPPFPPPVVAYYDAVLDKETLQRCRRGLLRANKSDRGETMLTLFRLTSFEPVPEGFDKVLAATRKAFPQGE